MGAFAKDLQDAFQAGPKVDQGRMFERLSNMLPQDMPLPQKLERLRMLQTRRPEPLMQNRLLMQLSEEFDEQKRK